MSWLTNDFSTFDSDFGEEKTIKLLTEEVINLKTGKKTKTEVTINVTVVPASISEKDLRLSPNLLKTADSAFFINSGDAEIKKNDIIQDSEKSWLVVELKKTQGITKAFVRTLK